MPGVGPLVVSSGLQATDRRSFLEMKEELARAYNSGEETVMSIAGDAINAAIRVYNRYNWPWEVLKVPDFNTASGTETYTVPAPFKAPLSCHVVTSSRPSRRLGFIPFSSYMTEYSLRADGNPTLYTFENLHETGQVTFWPRPGAVETMRICFYRRTPTLKYDDSPLDVPLEAEEGYQSWAWYEFVKRIGGEWGASRITSALSEARAARIELVAMVSERGDPVGLI